MKRKYIIFNDIPYYFQLFKYRNGRQGFMLESSLSSDWFSATVDLEKVPINSNEVIVKSHDFNEGLLQCLIDHGVIHKQAKSIVLGYHNVYICRLLWK